MNRLSRRRESSHFERWLTKVLAEIDTQIRQIELIARNYERDLLLDEPVALVGRERTRSEHDGAADDSGKPIYLCAQRAQFGWMGSSPSD